MSKPQTLNNRTHLRSHFIYYNLHKKRWSLKANNTHNPDNYDKTFTTPTVKGRVTGHADTILAWGVTPKISESGRLRVIREKRKNVHAGLVCAGCIVGPRTIITTDSTRTMSYNPYKAGYFYDRLTGKIVESARYVFMQSGRADCPPRVFYGDDLFYAYWTDDDGCIDHQSTVGFIDKSDLYKYIGWSDFTGFVRRTSEPFSKYLVCRNGCASYGDLLNC